MTTRRSTEIRSTLGKDESGERTDMRRGRSTANALWGNAPSVLVGDFLYARSFEMMVELGSMEVMRIISQATRVIAEGEVLQLSKVRDASTTEAVYMEVIRGKIGSTSCRERVCHEVYIAVVAVC